MASQASMAFQVFQVCRDPEADLALMVAMALMVKLECPAFLDHQAQEVSVVQRVRRA